MVVWSVVIRASELLQFYLQLPSDLTHKILAKCQLSANEQHNSAASKLSPPESSMPPLHYRGVGCRSPSRPCRNSRAAVIFLPSLPCTGLPGCGVCFFSGRLLMRYPIHFFLWHVFSTRRAENSSSVLRRCLHLSLFYWLFKYELVR